MAHGLHPSTDPYGRFFDEEYFPQRARIAGTSLAGGYRFFLSGHRGDWQYFVGAFLEKQW